MGILQISNNQRTLCKDGKPFFYLADTCWSAFTNITMEEWEYYLALRKNQGFNTLQINILPQWDASETSLPYQPFQTTKDGSFDYAKLDDAYFDHAKEMCEMAYNQGFQLALVVLWCNYVPDTWASKMKPDGILPMACLDAYFAKVHETFHDFHPLYVISGDTDFSESSIPYYQKALDALKPISKDCLFTLHIKGRLQEIPSCFEDLVDIYFYQSGHNAQVENRNTPITLAQAFYQRANKKPIINSEPCYERMSFSHHMYGMFYPFDIRRAAWMSVLSGACAGITYGAHGIYSWHKEGKAFGSGLGEGFNVPNPWNDAVLYPGAWDYGFMKHLMTLYEIEELVPFDGCLHQNEEICCAKATDKEVYFLYLPVNMNVSVTNLWDGYEVEAIDLTSKNVAYPSLIRKNNSLMLPMHRFAQDCLYVIQKKQDA